MKNKGLIIKKVAKGNSVIPNEGVTCKLIYPQSA